MGPASGPTFGRAALAARGGRGACGLFGRGVSSQGGALTATRPELYGLPFVLSCGIVAALRLLVASMCGCVRASWCGVNILNSMKILNGHSA